MGAAIIVVAVLIAVAFIAGIMIAAVRLISKDAHKS